MDDDRTPNDEGRDAATTTADTYHRHGDPDPSKWDVQQAVTDRPNDTPLDDDKAPAEYAVPNSTMATRAAERAKESAKQKKIADVSVDDRPVTATPSKTKSRKK